MKKVVIILVVLLTIAGYFLVTKGSASSNPFAPKPTPTITPTPEPEVTILSGKVTAERSATVSFATGGKLVWVGVKENDHVKKYQALASIDKQALQKQLQTSMNNYMTQRWTFEQTKDNYQPTLDKLLQTDAIKRLLDQSQYTLNNSVLTVEIANIALQNATIYSPIDGIVTHIDQPLAGVNITYLNENFVIVDPSSVYFQAEAEESDIANIKEGQATTISLDAYPEEKFESKIQSISFTSISGKTNTVYAVKMSLPENTNLKFRLDMGGEAELK